MRSLLILALGLLLTAAKDPPPVPQRCAGPAVAVKPAGDDQAEAKTTRGAAESWTEGNVTVDGTKIPYCAVAGTLTVHPRGWDDTSQKDDTAEASMFYTAYFHRGTDAQTRPITFLFNGGPGSATVWLHMGAFGPKRVEIANARHAAPAPYRLVNNDYSLLDASDLVFIDAPGTGFSRITGEDKEKSFYGVDEDAHAFASFITAFLSQYKRWNSPKYLFGESYGTTRAALLARLLQEDPGVDFNGIIMLSQVLGHDFFADSPRAAPGNDLPYQLALPTYAATSWYHSRTGPVPGEYLAEAERFAMGEYAAALAAGASLDPAAQDAVAAKLGAMTGVTPAVWRRANLRMTADEFRQELLRDRGLILGATDTRYTGHTLERTGKNIGHDPVDTAIASPFVSMFNDYARRVLKYNEVRAYRPMVNDISEKWSFRHQPPDAGAAADRAVNVLPDLAQAMTLNPLLKVQLNAGYFDLLTPYFQGKYEMRHLPVPRPLQDNIEYRCYQSGHMVYLTREALEQLHASAADFIGRTATPAARQVRRATLPDCPP